MTTRFALRQVVRLMCASGLIGFSTYASASAFQIWEQDAASVANYHAGRVALANDASIAYYNPAGMTRIKNQQIVVGDVGILTDIQYRGTVATDTYYSNAPQNTVAQGGSFSQIPNFHYVAPLSDHVAFGLSLAVPFGLKTDYGTDTPIRFASTTTELKVVDLSPALGFNLTQKLSWGLGADIERMSARFSQVDVLGPDSDTNSINKGWDTAWGYHTGILYQFTEATRAGLTYNSQVVHHFRGHSNFMGPLANAYVNAGFSSSLFNSTNTNASLTLPAFTTLSAYHKLADQWAIMGTAIYTQWTVLENITLKNVSGIDADGNASDTITVNLPAHYHNTWNVTVGADYYPTDKLTLRGGVGYDESPVPNRYRAVEVPDASRYAIAFGGHYQATQTLGVDLGWTHLFMQGDATIAPPVQVSGAQQVTTNGNIQASGDVFAAQLTWDIV